MKRIIALFLMLAGIAAAQTLPLPLVPLSAPVPASQAVTPADVKPAVPVPFVATADGTLLATTAPGQKIADVELFAWIGPGGNGRGLLVAHPWTQVTNVKVVIGTDDALCIVGDSHGTVVINCEAMASNWKDSKPFIAYTGASSALPGPMFGADVGFAAQIIGCTFQGSHFAGRIRDGVWNFVNDTIYISALSGLDMLDPCRANFISCRFVTIPKPAEANYWVGVPIRLSRQVGDKYVQTKLQSRLFFSGCTFNGVKIDGPGLCPGVSSSVFLKNPN